MGQGSSSAAQNDEAPLKNSYYFLLGVEKDATDDDIRKAYRRKALELHPDRNFGKEEEATSSFAEVQAAYEVLSDPQERAWYDSHESAILRGQQPGEEGDDYAYGIKVTTVDEISAAISAFHGRKIDYENIPDKFFDQLGNLFKNLAEEENKAALMEGLTDPDYPVFGGRSDTYEEVVRPFYSSWSGFSTRKTYFWADKYRPQDADDRRMRRAIDKENKKARDDSIREFNDAVRMLVIFVRKRDPRYKPNFQSDEERQMELRERSKAQQAKSRAANQRKADGVVPEWAQSREQADDPNLIGSFDDDELETVVEVECVVCNKSFKSEKQYQAHEQSKKHQQAVKRIIRQMKKENADLKLSSIENIEDREDTVATGDTVDIDDIEDKENTQNVEVTDDGSEADALLDTNSSNDNDHEDVLKANDNDDNDLAEKEKRNLEEGIEKLKLNPGYEKDSLRRMLLADGIEEESEDDEYASRQEVLAKFESYTDDDKPIAEVKKKVGKAAQKRAKRAAVATSDTHQQCGECGAKFTSNNQLFQHLKEFGHAVYVGSKKNNNSNNVNINNDNGSGSSKSHIKGKNKGRR